MQSNHHKLHIIQLQSLAVWHWLTRH